MLTLGKGRYVARIAGTPGDVARAQRLRWLAFVANRRPAPETAGDDCPATLPATGPATDRATGNWPGPDATEGADVDVFDALCRHVLVEEADSGTLVCCYRILAFADGAEIGRSYSAQYYELAGLQDYAGRMLEVGRFCIHPAWRDPAILRVAWAEMARIVEDEGVEMLFGCSSFLGTETEAYLDAFGLLRDRHLGPSRWLPRVKAPNVFRFAERLRRRRWDAKAAMGRMPPLLRTYLMMGGWVSDHAVVDRDLGTLHVFTGLEIRSIPAARVRALRGAAG